MSYNLLSALNVMWQGMLGIFVVMILISLIVKLLAKVTK